jgi:AhpC/TSA family protein
MSATILYNDKPPYASGATAEKENLWLPVGELHAATGWELRPEGACRGDVCVPIPRGREGEFLREGRARFNVAELARLLGQPVVHEDVHGVWSFGESASDRGNAMRSLQAPDFTLPDLDGRPHALADYRGKKVFLVFWASW